MFRLRLEVTGGQGPAQTREFKLAEKQKIHIGRELCELLINDRSVSRKHLGFAVKAGKLLVGDLGSSFGTLHNGHPLHRAHAVKGDLFQIGSYTILIQGFELVDKPASAWSRLQPVWQYLHRLKPHGRRGWAASFAVAAVVVMSLHLFSPSDRFDPSQDPYAPTEAGFGDLAKNWKNVRRWVRSKSIALRGADPYEEHPVDYDRIFED